MNNEYISACASTDPGCLVNVPLELSNIVPPALILGSQVQIKDLVCQMFDWEKIIFRKK